MSVSSSGSSLSYTITVSTDALVFNLPVFELTDITLIRKSAAGVESTLTYGVDWTFTPSVIDSNSPMKYPSGGTINLAISYTDGSFVAKRVLTATQPTRFPLGGSFPSPSVEAAFDRATFLVQQLDEILGRAIRFPASEPSFGLDLPTSQNRLSKFLGFDSLGNLAVLEGADASITVSVFGAALVLAADAAAARAVLDAQQEVLTTRGDVVRGDAAGVAERIALGAAGQALVSDGTDALWGYPAGTIQHVVKTEAGYASFPGTWPFDDTIPQITEGSEVLSQAFTPRSASSVIELLFSIPVRTATQNNIGFGVFQGGVNDALGVVWRGTSSTGIEFDTITGVVSIPSPGTSPVTFSVRGGADATTTWYVNGDASTRKFGGAMVRRLHIREIYA